MVSKVVNNLHFAAKAHFPYSYVVYRPDGPKTICGYISVQTHVSVWGYMRLYTLGWSGRIRLGCEQHFFPQRDFWFLPFRVHTWGIIG